MVGKERELPVTAEAAVPETYDFGNARLRAMRSRLFDEQAYQELLAKDLDGLIASLAQTDYQADVEAALLRYRGLPCVHEAVRTSLARTLNKLAGFYQGHPRRLVDLLLARWDRRNLLAILRAQAAPPPLRRTEEIMSLLVPTGRLDETALAQLVAQPGLRATVDLMVAWRLPDAETAETILRAWPAYQQSENLATLEHALNRAYAYWLDSQLDCSRGQSLPPLNADRDLVRWFLCAEVDHSNLMLALRLHSAGPENLRLWPVTVQDRPLQVGTSGAGLSALFLPAGSLSPRLLEQVVRAHTRDDVLRLLLVVPGMSRWQAALEEWVQSGDLPALETNLEYALTREAAQLFVAGDPLGIAVPIAYVWSKDNEVRNLRLLGHGLANQLDPVTIRDQLLVLW